MPELEPDHLPFEKTNTRINSVTLLSRREILDLPGGTAAFARYWAGVHRATQARLAAAVARFLANHNDVTFHLVPAFCVPDYDATDPDVVALVMGYDALPHVDMTHAEMERAPDLHGDHWVKLVTACGCESRAMRYPAPLPRVIPKSMAGDRPRWFHRHGETEFGTVIYREVER